jgi:hypothetical protein
MEMQNVTFMPITLAYLPDFKFELMSTPVNEQSFWNSGVCYHPLPHCEFSWPTIAVDTHICRVRKRMKSALGATVDQVEQT